MPPSPFGGAQRLAIDLAARQRARGQASYVLFTGPGETAWAAAQAAAVPIIGGARDVKSRLNRIRTVRRELTRGQFDVVHLHMPPPWLTAALPGRRRFALITHLHVNPTLQEQPPTIRRRLESVAAAMTLTRSDILLPVSRWVESAWRRAHPQVRTPATVVYNGTDIPSAGTPVRSRQDRFVVGMACRLSERKGLEEFLPLAQRIYRLAPQARFKIAGDGPMKSELEHQAAELGLASVLEFVGFTLDIAGFWQAIDIAAFTAPFEPFGLRLIEPIAHGRPVIAYRNNSGSDEVIAMCRGIKAVEYGDFAALADIAVGLGCSPQHRDEIAAAGREDLIQHFSMDVMERNVRAAYDAALYLHAATMAARAA